MAWDALARATRVQIEQLLGRRVVAAASQPGGYSEGLAVRARLSDGAGVFIKAAPVTTAAAVHHRREITVSARLPVEAPVPRLLHTVEDGEWVALIFEEIVGHLPAQPWLPEELERAVGAVAALADMLTPAPMDASLLAPPRLGGWSDLLQGPARDKVRALSGWAGNHAEDLAALEAEAQVEGSTLLHGDLYPFNLLLTVDRVIVVDWAHAWVGAPFCDAVTLLSSARLSGVDPEPIAARHPLTQGLTRQQLDGLLALHSGFLLRRVVSAPPTMDPNIVAMMAALGRASLTWLQARWSTTG